MKSNLLTIAICLCAGICTLMAQSQRPFSYQAIARNAVGEPVTNQSVSLQFTIRDSIATGTMVYRESKMVTTNSLGLFNTSVGSGFTSFGSFAAINWGSGKKFLQVEIDIAGGMSLVDIGTTELLSVPYAHHAAVADNVLNFTEQDGDSTNELQTIYRVNNTIELSHGGGSIIENTYSAGNGINIDANNVISTSGHYVGELFGGGIVFHVYKDANGVEHGLIAAPYPQSFAVPWSNVTSTLIGFIEYGKGQENTNAIIGQAGHTSSAALLCDNFSDGGFSDWYLPAAWEMNLLYQNVYTLNKVLENDNNPSTVIFGLSYYWSSTEASASSACYVDFYTGELNCSSGFGSKSYGNTVRAIRAF